MMNVRDVGAKGDGIADDAPAFNAAFNYSDRVYAPSGDYKFGSMLNMNRGRALSLDGDGWGTRLIAGSDFGPYLIDTGDGNLDQRFHSHISNMTLLGTGNVAIGGTPMTMRAIRVRAKSKLDDLLIQGGFHSALSLDGDHISVSRVSTGAVQYGVYCPAGQATFGDVDFLDCTFLGSLASVGVQDGGACSGITFRNTTLGFSPYGFYREPGTTHQSFLDFTTFEGGVIEAYGNAAIYDASDGAIMRSCVIAGGGSQDDTYKLASHGLRAGIFVVPTMLWNTFKLGDTANSPMFKAGTEGYIKASNLAFNNRVVAVISAPGYGDNLFDRVEQSGRPFWINASSWDRSNVFVEGNSEPTSTFLAETFTTFEAIPRYACVAINDGRDNVSKTGTTIAGVALHSMTGPGRVAVQTHGIGGVTLNGNVVPGDALKPDPSFPGRVIKNTTPTTTRSLGIARGAAGAGATIQVFINSSLW